MEIGAPPLHELADATADLIMQLHNRDTEELLHASKGNGRDGEGFGWSLGPSITIYREPFSN